MENTEQQTLDIVLRQIREEQGEDFVYDRAGIMEELNQNTPLLTNLPVKLLTILGGIFASLFLLGSCLPPASTTRLRGCLLPGCCFWWGPLW